MWLPPALLLLSLPGYLSIQGPKFVRGSERGSVTVECRYKPRWETYTKWWCQGASWESCKILLQTTGSEQEVKTDRMSIRDNQSNHSLTVTMTQLRRDDTDIYWCGIERLGPDLGVQINVTVDPGASPMGQLTLCSHLMPEPIIFRVKAQSPPSISLLPVPLVIRHLLVLALTRKLLALQTSSL